MRRFKYLPLFFSAFRSLLVNLENGFMGRGFEQFCSQLHHYCTYVDNIYLARRVLQVGPQHGDLSDGEGLMMFMCTVCSYGLPLVDHV